MTKHKRPVKVEELIRAYKALEKFSAIQKTKQDKIIIIKAFEICYELAWNLIENTVIKKGVYIKFPSNIFIEAEKINLIKKPQIWLGFLAKRNKILYNYDMQVVEEVLEIIPRFKRDLEDLIEALKKIYKISS